VDGGGEGEVYKLYDQEKKRFVALKVAGGELWDSEGEIPDAAGELRPLGPFMAKGNLGGNVQTIEALKKYLEENNRWENEAYKIPELYDVVRLKGTDNDQADAILSEFIEGKRFEDAIRDNSVSSGVWEEKIRVFLEDLVAADLAYKDAKFGIIVVPANDGYKFAVVDLGLIVKFSKLPPKLQKTAIEDGVTAAKNYYAGIEKQGSIFDDEVPSSAENAIETKIMGDSAIALPVVSKQATAGSPLAANPASAAAPAGRSEMRTSREMDVVDEAMTPFEAAPSEVGTPTDAGTPGMLAPDQPAPAQSITVNGEVYKQIGKGGQGVVYKNEKTGATAKIFYRAVTREELEGFKGFISKLAESDLAVATVEVAETSDGTPVLVRPFVAGKPLGQHIFEEIIKPSFARTEGPEKVTASERQALNDVLDRFIKPGSTKDPEARSKARRLIGNAKDVLGKIDAIGEEFLGVSVTDRRSTQALAQDDYANFIVAADGNTLINIDPVDLGKYLKAQEVNGYLQLLLQPGTLDSAAFVKGKGIEAGTVVIKSDVPAGHLKGRYMFIFNHAGVLKIERLSEDTEPGKEKIELLVEMTRTAFAQFHEDVAQGKINLSDPTGLEKALAALQPGVNLLNQSSETPQSGLEDNANVLLSEETRESDYPTDVTKQDVNALVQGLIKKLADDLEAYDVAAANPKAFTEASAQELADLIAKIKTGLQGQNAESPKQFNQQIEIFKSLVSNLVKSRISDLKEGLEKAQYKRKEGDGNEPITELRVEAYEKRIKTLEDMIKNNGLGADLAAELSAQKAAFEEIKKFTAIGSSPRTSQMLDELKRTGDVVFPKGRSASARAGNRGVRAGALFGWP